MLDKKKMPDLDPLSREALAAWIEYEGQRLMKALGKTVALQETHPDYPHLSRQAAYYRHANAFAIYLAYRVRTAETKKLISPAVQAR